MSDEQRSISSERKGAFYIGRGMMLIGFLLFISTFVTAAANFGNFNNFEGRVRSESTRAVLGMILLVAGGFVSVVGSRGLAGSGLLLDPNQARKELKPWNDMAGEMADDALSKIGVVKALEDSLSSRNDDVKERNVVKVRCRECRALNDEEANFCDQCGAAM